MYGKLKDFLTQELANIKAAGLYKNERIITTPQRADIKVNAGSDVLNFCANNYLGLSDNQRLIKAAKEAMDTHGYGMSSVRFICGTQDLHKQLEAAISDYFKTEDTILYAACFDANGGLFEPLFTEEDAIISDALNHASIIDGVRLCKAKRYRYANADMADLERCLQEAQAQRHRIIATDGVFSMDGNVAPMDKICELAEKYDALVMVDESHSAGVVGPTGHGVAEQYNVYGRVDIFTGTLGKAFGGAMGGFTTGKKEIIDMLRQRSRPYLFSNSVAPAIVGASLEMFKMLKESDALHTKLMNNVSYFREKMLAAGFDIKPTQSAICAVMLYDAKLSQDFAAKMQEEGIYVTGFYYPVVPKGQARIRVQVSAGHTTTAGSLHRSLHQGRQRIECHQITNPYMPKTSLDAIDRKILKYLIKNARMPFLEIARECGISGAAIHQRIRKLDDSGVILGSRLIVDPKMMGFDVCAHISITLKDPQLLKQTVEQLKEIPEIVEAHFITGSGNILVKLYCVDNEHLMRTIFDGILRIQGVASTETQISLQEAFQRQVNIDFIEE